MGHTVWDAKVKVHPPPPKDWEGRVTGLHWQSAAHSRHHHSHKELWLPKLEAGKIQTGGKPDATEPHGSSGAKIIICLTFLSWLFLFCLLFTLYLSYFPSYDILDDIHPVQICCPRAIYNEHPNSISTFTSCGYCTVASPMAGSAVAKSWLSFNYLVVLLIFKF